MITPVTNTRLLNGKRSKKILATQVTILKAKTMRVAHRGNDTALLSITASSTALLSPYFIVGRPTAPLVPVSNSLGAVRSEVFTAVTMKNAAF
jgi:hypothetical protein